MKTAAGAEVEEQKEELTTEWRKIGQSEEEDSFGKVFLI